MPSELEMMIERYKAELMKYQPTQPQPKPQPQDTPQPIELPQPAAPQPQEQTEQPPIDIPQPEIVEAIAESDIPIEPTRELEQTPINRSNDEGYLQIRVSQADNALPIEGALATVTDSKGNLVAVMLTDDDGVTRTVGLPTLPREESESPEYVNPYDTYNINIRRKGFYDFVSRNVPIFGGITNTQQVSLIPLPEFTSSGTTTVQNTEPFNSEVR